MNFGKAPSKYFLTAASNNTRTLINQRFHVSLLQSVILVDHAGNRSFPSQVQNIMFLGCDL